MNREHVNMKNTGTWVKVNEDAKSVYWRKYFCDLHGGMFYNDGKHWNGS